jgi:hypothetical protein
MAQNDVASSLMIDRVANFTERLYRVGAGANRANASRGDFHNGFSDLGGDWLTMFFQTFDVPLNGVTNIRHCFVVGFPLGDTAGQSRAFGDKYPIFVWFDCDAKFHAVSVAIGGAAGNAPVDALTFIGFASLNTPRPTHSISG